MIIKKMDNAELKKHCAFFVVALAILVAIALRQAGFYVDGLIDNFIFGSVSSSYLLAIIDTL